MKVMHSAAAYLA